MTLAEQMGNIGSEVNRAAIWESQGMMEQREKAFDRLLELFDLTIGDARWKGSKRKELARAREVIRDAYVPGVGGDASLVSWIKYFDAFAFYARSSR